MAKGNNDSEPALKARSEKNEQKLLLKDEKEFISVFLEQSLGLYVKAKSMEHNDQCSNQGIKQFTKEDVTNLLNGLEDSSKNLDPSNVKSLKEGIVKNLDNYINKMDKELVQLTNNILSKEGNLDPNALAKDTAMVKAATQCSFIKISEELKVSDFNIQSSIEAQKDTHWKKIADLLTKILPSVAAFCEKKDKEVKIKKIAKKVVLEPEYLASTTSDKREPSVRSAEIIKNKGSVSI